MIEYPYKRVFGLIGAPRSGKDTVAKYLQESRNFVTLAFADRIKEEFGISKEDFETAKITGEIDRLRKELWNFSDKKKAEDPNYFIRLVMEEADSLEESVVITDVRTENEFMAFFDFLPTDIITRIYNVNYDVEKFDNDYIFTGTRISRDFYWHQRNTKERIKQIDNKENGLFAFYSKLSSFFFREDIMDLSGPSDLSEYDKQTYKEWRAIVSSYISQFDIREHM
jgi:adenylate kinase family enzyme